MRKQTIDRDDYWLGLAFLIAAASKNPDDKQGAIIVSPANEALSLACDGSPSFMQDSSHFVHAELNALFGAKTTAKDGTLYITHTPCYQCCLAAIAAGIKKIIYYNTEEISSDALDATKEGYLHTEPFHGNLNWVRDYVKSLEMLEIFDVKRDKYRL